MLCRWSSCSRRENLNFLAVFFRDETGNPSLPQFRQPSLPQFRLNKKRPEMGQASMSRARTPATQHQRPSNLAAITLRAVECTTSKV